MNTKQNTNDFWADAEIVSIYTRREAIQDGALMDVSDVATEAGFNFPVAITSAVHSILETSAKKCGETIDWPIWDLLTMLKFNIGKNKDSDRINFKACFYSPEAKKKIDMDFYSLIGPGDDAEPVITIMLPNED